MYFGFCNLGLVRHSRKKQTIEKNGAVPAQNASPKSMQLCQYFFIILLRQKSVNTRLGELTQNIRNYQTEKKT